MVSDSVDPKRQFGFRLVVLARRWRHALDAELASLGLSDASWRPLFYLERLGDGVRQKELAAAADLDSSSLVRLLDVLEGSGLIERRVVSEDRRSKRVFLTQKGRETLDVLRSRIDDFEARLLAGIASNEMAAATDVFAKIEQRLPNSQDKLGTPP